MKGNYLKILQFTTNDWEVIVPYHHTAKPFLLCDSTQSIHGKSKSSSSSSSISSSSICEIHSWSRSFFFSSASSVELTAFVDSDWVACQNTRLSISAFCIYIGESLFYYKKLDFYLHIFYLLILCVSKYSYYSHILMLNV